MPGYTQHRLDDRGAAAPARLTSAPVHPEGAATPEVTRRRLDRAVPVEVEHLVGATDQAGQVRDPTDRCLRSHARGEAQLVGIHVPDAGQPGLVEQRLLDGAVGVLTQPAQGLVWVPVGT